MADESLPPEPDIPIQPQHEAKHSRPPSKQAVGERQAMMRLASAGFELASFSLLLGGGGYLVDRWLGNITPYFAIAGLLVGFSLGFYRLIILASKMN